MGTLWQDLRFALRTLRKNPGFTIVAVLTLAVGIAAATAIFSVANAVLLKRLPYDAPDRLVLIWGTHHQAGQLRDVISRPNFFDLKRRSTVIEDMAAFEVTEMTVRNDEGAGVIPRLEVTPEFFDALGVEPLVGRTFNVKDGWPGRNQVALISHGFWKWRFGGDPDIVGKTMGSIGQPHTIVGILPPSFEFFVQPDVVTPLVPTVLEQQERTHYHYWVIARLKKGVTPAQAEVELDTAMGLIARDFPDLSGWEVTVDPLATTLVESVRPALLLLLGAVGIMLLIACVNLANLLLIRGLNRRRELAIRVALGADRRRLLRQLMTESCTLAVLGGSLGLLAAVWLIDAFSVVLPSYIPIPDSAATVSLAPVRLDGHVLAFSAILSGLTVFLFGFAPALSAARVEPQQALKETDSRTTASPSQHRARNLLVVFQVTLATALLIGTGLMLRTVVALVRSDPGFSPEKVLTMYVGRLHEKTDRERALYYREIVESVQGVPGVMAVGLNDYVLLQGEDDFEGFYIEGQPPPQPGMPHREEWRRVSPDYFQVMGIPLMRGRLFTGTDNIEAPSVVLINQAMAIKYWPDEDPVGRRLGITHDAYRWSEIVGVVGDVRYVGLDRPPKPLLYVPYDRAPRPLMALFVKTAGEPEFMTSEIKQAVWSVDNFEPIFNINTLARVRSNSIAIHRLTLFVGGVLGAISLLLATVGIFGVVSFSVSQRLHEIGIRRALGAQDRDLISLVLRQGAPLAFAGVILGVFVSVPLTWTMAGLLYGVSPFDPPTFAAVAVALLVAALLACYLPVRRAMAVEPMAALRYE